MPTCGRTISLSLRVREEEQPAEPEIIRWTASLAAGEEKAWRDFFDRYHGRLTGFVRASWQGNSGAVDDLVQDTFIRAVRHMRRFDQEEVLWCWLVRLARSSIADRGKIQKRRWSFLTRFREWEVVRTAEAPDLFENEELVSSALEALDDTSRLLLQYKYAEGRSVQEIARELGLTPKATESRLTRARNRLRKQVNRQQPT